MNNSILILSLLFIVCNCYHHHHCILLKSSSSSSSSISLSLSSKSKVINQANNDINIKTSSSNTNKHNYNNLITDTDRSIVRVAGSRTILPGDYVVHEEYGIGQYVGIRMVDLTPARKSRTWQPVVVVKYHDAELTWFQRVVDKELWLFRQAESGSQELSSILDTKKWKKERKLQNKQVKIWLLIL